MTTTIPLNERRNGQIGTASLNDVKEAVRLVYEFIADEYDDRIPGTTPADRRFTETEADFVLSRVHPGDTVLDLGCGTGRMTIPLAAIAREVVGLDISSSMLQHAEKNATRAGVRPRFEQGDMCDLPFPDHSFDLVTSTLALMHVPPENRLDVFRECSRVLRPGGTMIVEVKNSVFEDITAVDRFASVDVTNIDNKTLIFTGTRDGENRAAPWHSFSPEQLNRLFATVGLIPVHLRGNCSISAWLADAILADLRVYAAVTALERILCDTAPFNGLGYHILAEAVKPG